MIFIVHFNEQTFQSLLLLLEIFKFKLKNFFVEHHLCHSTLRCFINQILCCFIYEIYIYNLVYVIVN